MGAMHNPKKPAPFAPSRDNAVKGVVLVQGAQKQEWIFDRKEHSITANLGDDKVVLHKGLQIQSDGGDALVKTKHNLTLTAEQTQTLKAGTDWHAQAERSAKLNSGATELALVPQKAQLNAAEIDAQGSATVKLGSGPSKLELTTARAKISALNTEVQGAESQLMRANIKLRNHPTPYKLTCYIDWRAVSRSINSQGYWI
ncbi:hypothetical protein BGZ97_012468 [Linnemannia gamsii]|uniref:Uncharacterized protein n=1 Tax=Linnemannia gamsii TaxID=64522 RepID=A0A9P6RKC5_9FUNG|nr:hypothetical protein BGZ97_012468 [Linnemannia gamsii]